jgi:hypothetical protein
MEFIYQGSPTTSFSCKWEDVATMFRKDDEVYIELQDGDRISLPARRTTTSVFEVDGEGASS